MKGLVTLVVGLVGLAGCAFSEDVAQQKLMQLQQAMKDTNEQIETTDNGVQANTSNSLRAGPRSFNLLEDTSVRKKMLHFDRERAPERVVHALGHGAYGQFESYGDWSNLTMACWLQSGAVSEAFSRFSVVVASIGGSANQRDTHGFATKIYSACGNHDLVGNHVPSFFINDGSQFPDLVHAVKAEVNKGFPTFGIEPWVQPTKNPRRTAHTTAYDFFNLHPESAFQLMTVISDLGLPRDVRHIRGNGVHTYRFINAQGKSTLFKWYWLPKLGLRTLFYDEAQKLSGKNPDFQRVDLYNNIAAGIYPEWELCVQLFPDDGTYTYKGYDLIIPTVIVPFEVNPPVKLGKLTLNRNFNNFFAEPESISYAPSNVVDGVSWVPDPLLQWRLMAYDDTSTHRHNSPNGATLPVNRPIAPVNNNYRDGYMQPFIYEGESISTPNSLGGVQEPGPNATLQYTTNGEMAGRGPIGRYAPYFDWWGQAQLLWGTMDKYAQQHTVDGYRFELGNVANASTAQSFIDMTLNNIDNCLARRVAWGIGATMPAVGSGPRSNITNSTTPYPSLFPINPGQEPHKSNAGLQVALIANGTLGTMADVQAMMPMLMAEEVSLEIVGPRIGMLKTGVMANVSFTTTSDVFYDAVFIGAETGSSNGTGLDMNSYAFVMEAYSHGKAIGALGSSGSMILKSLGIDGMAGVYSGAAAMVTREVLNALSGPVRFPQRFPTDDIKALCG